MADNYLEFSEMLTNLSAEEAKWLKHQLEVVHVIDGQEYPEDDLPDSGDTGEATWIGCRAYRDMDDFDDDYGDVGFEYELKKDDEDGKRYLWMYSQGNASLDNVAHFVRKYLRKFRPSDCWYLTYSATCSKPRLGEFGGGAIFVTASEVKWFNSWDFVEEERDKFKGGKAGKSGKAGADKPRVVIEVSGGLVQDAYCSDPQTELIVIDLDCEGRDLSENGMMEVAGWFAYVKRHEIYPLDKLAGTDTGNALSHFEERENNGET